MQAHIVISMLTHFQRMIRFRCERRCNCGWHAYHDACCGCPTDALVHWQPGQRHHDIRQDAAADPGEL
jgi:hypothetical protein